MGALSANRVTRVREGKTFDFAVAANKHVYAGSLVNLNSGYAVPATDEAAISFIGVAVSEVNNNPGNAGAKKCRMKRVGTHLLNKASAVQADVGKDMYVVDDQTVGGVGDVVHGIKVGRCVGIEDSSHVWVAIDNPGDVFGTADATTTTTTTSTSTSTTTTTETTTTTTEGG
jgi:hypothetical protein